MAGLVAVEPLSGGLRFRSVAEPGLQRRRVVGPVGRRRRSSGDATWIQSYPFWTGCQADRSDGGGDVTSRGHRPAGDGTERPCHQVLSEWRLGHERVLRRG